MIAIWMSFMLAVSSLCFLQLNCDTRNAKAVCFLVACMQIFVRMHNISCIVLQFCSQPVGRKRTATTFRPFARDASGLGDTPFGCRWYFIPPPTPHTSGSRQSIIPSNRTERKEKKGKEERQRRPPVNAEWLGGLIDVQTLWGDLIPDHVISGSQSHCEEFSSAPPSRCVRLVILERQYLHSVFYSVADWSEPFTLVLMELMYKLILWQTWIKMSH